MDLAYIPSPSHGVVHLGPIPLRGYAFCIIIGVFVAVWLGNKRWVARGGKAGTIADIAVWAVPFGLVGGRLYHVITDYELYFTDGKDWVDAFKIWQGGLGIWGAIALGARRRLDRLPPPRHRAARVRRRHRARHRLRPGHRPLGQLVQPGAVRQPDAPALGPEDHQRRGRPDPRHLPADVPVRVPVVHRRRAAGALGRPPLPARPRPGLRAVRRRVLRRPRLDRAHAVRLRPPHPGPAAQRLDGDHRLRRRRRSTSCCRPGCAPAVRRSSSRARPAGGDGARRTPGSDEAADGRRRRPSRPTGAAPARAAEQSPAGQDPAPTQVRRGPRGGRAAGRRPAPRRRRNRSPQTSLPDRRGRTAPSLPDRPRDSHVFPQVRAAFPCWRRAGMPTYGRSVANAYAGRAEPAGRGCTVTTAVEETATPASRTTSRTTSTGTSAAAGCARPSSARWTASCPTSR